jgi:hypothetical protein
MRDLDVVVESLEQLAEREGDIAAEVYERFFASCGSAVPLMGHSDVHMRGRMLDEVFGLLTWDTRYEGAWHSRIQSLLSAISRDSGSETND